MSIKQRKAKQIRKVEFDKNCIRECSIFRTLDHKSEKRIEYFYGGGVYNEDYCTIELFPDHIRPKSKSISLRDVIHAAFDNDCCDIMLSDGTWISGLKVKKVTSDRCCFQRMLFNDKRIVVPYGNYMVVNLHLLEIDVKSKVRFLRGVPLSPEILKYKNPLTFMYTKVDGKVYVGYWDVIKHKPVGELREFSGALDIFT